MLKRQTTNPAHKNLTNKKKIVKALDLLISTIQKKPLYKSGICSNLCLLYEYDLIELKVYLYIIDLVSAEKQNHINNTNYFFPLDEAGRQKRIELLNEFKKKIIC